MTVVLIFDRYFNLGAPMNLLELISAVETLDDTLCIVAKRPWTPESPAQLVRLTDDFRIPDAVMRSGFDYFLEVSTLRDDIIGEAYHRLTPAQQFAAVIFYADHDAYPEWFFGP